jgi:membrane-bound lytic murein transglycosylase A
MKCTIQLILLLLCFYNVSAISSTDKPNVPAEPVITGYDFTGNGWVEGLACTPLTLMADTPNVAEVTVTPEFKRALTEQIKLLDKKVAAKTIHESETQVLASLISVFKLVENANSLKLSGLNFKRFAGEKGCGNVLYTGYYTSSIQLKRHADNDFKFAIYRMPTMLPNEQLPTRAQIDHDHALGELGLEIGYAKSLLDVYLMHIQGSSFAHFIDTDEVLTLGVAGKNGHPYQSLGKYMVEQGYITKKDISLASIKAFFKEHPDKLSLLNINPSYVFYEEQSTQPKTASGATAFKQATVAVDEAVIPLGSVLLMNYPRLNKSDNVVKKHQFTLAIASDTGSAIKGPGHIDVYYGADSSKASHFKHYGQVWVLIKEQE